MNILIITQLYPQPDDEGQNKPTHTVEYFAKEWVQMGHHVIVAHCSSKFPFVYYLIPSKVKNKLAVKTSNIFPSMKSRRKIVRSEYGIDVYRYPMLKIFPGHGYSAKTMQKQAHEIINDLEKNGIIPELVVGHFANPSTELVAILAGQYHAKSSIVFHGDCNKNTLERYKLKELSGRIGAIGVRSMIEGKLVKKLLELAYDPFICYSGVPNEVVAAAEITCKKHDYSKGTRYIWVGSFIKRKNLNQVMKAFSIVAKDDDTLEIIGSGPDESDFHSTAVSLPGNERIMFLGRLPRTDVMHHMKGSHIFTLISDQEVFGMVYIEAMLQGCIVIASEGGGFDGIIINGKNGFICEPGNTEMLVDIYKKIQSMTIEERNAIGQAAIDTAIHYSEKEVAENYLDDILKGQTLKK